jgi:hypothetical protein
MDRKHNDTVLLDKFIAVYCRNNHRGRHRQVVLGRGLDFALCPDYTQLLDYAFEKLDNCPFDPKCKGCRVHWYAEPYRSQSKT